MTMMELPTHAVTCVAWNNEGTTLVVGLPGGFIAYSTELLLGEAGWLREVRRGGVPGGVGAIALHGQSNIILISGWAASQRAGVALLDLAATSGEEVLARAGLPAPVESLRLHPRLLLVGTESGHVHLFNHALQKLETFRVSRGSKLKRRPADTMALATILVEQAASGMCFSLLHGIILGPSTGSVRCIRYVGKQRVESSLLQRSLGGIGEVTSNPLKTKVVELHRNEVQCIAITPDGTRALTVSERGTSLKLLDVEKGIVICQFSRGKIPNLVHALALLVSSTDTVAACISETGTLHLFHVTSTGISNRLSVGSSGSTKSDIAETGNDITFMKAWNDYRNSVGSKSRLTIPDDLLYKSLYEQEAYNGTLYNLTLRPIAKKASCLAFLVQRAVSTSGVAMKARLLSIHVELGSTAATANVNSTGDKMKVIRSFYFPKEDL